MDKYAHFCAIVSIWILWRKYEKKRRTNQCHYGCAVEAALDVIGNKWKGVILFHLLDDTRRFNELRRLIPSAT